MRKLSRLFVFLLFTGLFTAYAPITQAQQGDGDISPTQQGRGPSFGNSYGSRIGNKAVNAVTNLGSSVLEIPKNIINTTNKSNIIFGAVGGLCKGMMHMAGRIGVGITDLVTIPIPTKPIAQPVYIWNDFDVDTSYGPVFRLDLSDEEAVEEEAPAVQAPEPVAAPVVAAPKPEPIDNTKQLHQETNQKLDTIFKKEMKK